MKGKKILAARDERLESVVGGKYRIVRFLAKGGMGAVYEAQHLVVKRRFAVKFLHADLAQRRDALARFKREAAAAGTLEGENIAAVVDFGMARDGAPYIVMEYLDGVDLGRLLAVTGPLPVGRAADLVLQACRGIEEAHAAGVIHRDLKPSNLFVCRRTGGTDLLKIVDFGVAKLVASETSSAVTRTGAMVGTPSYMSPEQARGEGVIDQRSDVYALGAIFYELLSGRPPHAGESFNAIIHHIATQPSLPLSCEGREFPANLVELVNRALAASPADRQASAAQLAEELAPFASREIWPPPPDTSVRPLARDDSTELEPRAAPSEEGRSFSGSHVETSPGKHSSKRSRVAVVGLLFAAGTLAFLWATNGRERLPASPRATQAPDLGPQQQGGAALSRAPNLRPVSTVPEFPSVAPPPAVSASAPGPTAHATSYARRVERPGPMPGRPEGLSAGGSKKTVALTKPGDSAGVRPIFDTRNPFE
jgi:eukaryotic-like serine/threonine-protein kinase